MLTDLGMFTLSMSTTGSLRPELAPYLANKESGI